MKRLVAVASYFLLLFERFATDHMNNRLKIAVCICES